MNLLQNYRPAQRIIKTFSIITPRSQAANWSKYSYKQYQIGLP
jgi:hypothetical protein